MTTMHASPRVAVLLAGIALSLGGCPGGNSPGPANGPPAAPKSPLTLLIVDDPALGEVVIREWRASTEQDLKVQNLTAAEAEKAGRLPGDAIVFPAGLIGQLAEPGLIQPLSNEALEDPDFDHRDMFAPIRMQEIRWGNRTFAVPLGSPRLLVAYRADIFEKLQLQPPADWPQYQQLVERLADRAVLGDLAPPAEQPWRAASEPLADGWAGQLLLARAAAYALHRDQVSPLFQFDTMEPLIAEPPYVRALDELVAAAKTGQFGGERWSPTQALDELLAGRTALAIAWPAPAATLPKSTASAFKIGWAILPGSPVAYNLALQNWEPRTVDEATRAAVLAPSGRLGAVSSNSAEPQRAESLLVWLASREASGLVSPSSSSTTLFRNSQVASPGRWTGALPAESALEYASALSATMELPRAFPGLRLPGRSEYLAALDQAVQAAASGHKPPGAALGETAAKWREITNRLGVEKQKKALAHSLGQ